MTTPSPRKTYVLIHGAYHGGWCWAPVADRLRARFHVVHTPTMTGHGDRSHLRAIGPTLETFAQDMLQLFHYEDISDAIVVGHSFGGSLVSILADRIPQAIRHLVYLDAMVLQSGQSPADISPPGHIQRYADRAFDTEGGAFVPPPDPSYLGITDPAQQEWIKARMTPQPLATLTAPLVLQNPLCNGLPATYIAVTDPLFPTTARSRELAQTTPGWTYQEIPTAHNAMMLMPDRLTEMLEAIG